MAVKRKILRGLQATLYWSGLSWFFLKRNTTGGAMILMYHSVSTPEKSYWHDQSNTIDSRVFRKQMAFLAANRNVIPFSSLINTINENGEIPVGTVVITFDDGYLDNLEVAAPILKEFNIPALVYLCTGYIRRGENQWIDRLHTIFLKRDRDTLKLSGSGQTLNLALKQNRDLAFAEVNLMMITASREKREEILADLAGQLQPADDGPRLTMNWEEVRKLKKEFPLVELGVHTVDHLDMRQASEQEGRREIELCMNEFKAELEEAPLHFSFPYGRADSKSLRVVRESGLHSSVLSGSDIFITPKADAFSLSRIKAPSSMTQFRYRTSGAHPALSLKLFGRA